MSENKKNSEKYLGLRRMDEVREQVRTLHN
jgi:hypothetical protein